MSILEFIDDLIARNVMKEEKYHKYLIYACLIDRLLIAICLRWCIIVLDIRLWYLMDLLVGT